MQKIFWLLLALLPIGSWAQVSDNFSDGDFTNNPVWVGSTTDFIINGSGQLQLSDDIAATTYLSTPFSSEALGIAEWKLFVKTTVAAPSSTNYSRIYLVSDQPDLSGSLNGYYLQLGEAGSIDAIQLFRQTGTLSFPVLRGSDAMIAAAFQVGIKITRDAFGQWQLWADYTGGENYSLETSGTDNTHTNANYVGIRCTYTSTNVTKFFFDDIAATNTYVDLTEPTIQEVTIQSPTQLQLLFSEEVEPISAQTFTNYSVNNSVGIATLAELQPDGKTVLLTFGNSFPNADTSVLSVAHVEDLVGNGMLEEESKFFFFEAVPATPHDIVFTEIFADPAPSIGMPEAEYVELLNRSNKIFNLANWKYKDATTEKTLPQKFLRPGEYLVLVNSSSVSLFSGFNNVAGIATFPTLTNTGEPLVLRDENGVTIDSVFYDDDWYKSEEAKAGGYSLERINYENFCVEEAENWTTSKAVTGGTPGSVNSVVDNTPDTRGPELTQAMVVSPTQVTLVFNERLATMPPHTTAFQFNPTVNVLSASFTDASLNSLALVIDEPLLPSTPYVVTLSDVFDCVGNSIDESNNSISVLLSEQAQPLDILMTEIFADPNPVLGLPEAEFVEIINRSNRVINLKDFLLTDGSSVGVLPNHLLHPAEYAILTATTSVSAFSLFDNVIGVNNFPSLNNSGESLTLKNSIGETIDSLHYSLAWYQDEDKQNGGWTLERKDLNNFCLEETNWQASTSLAGGTPGTQNSVFTTQADSERPQLQNVLTLSETEVRLVFNEKLSTILPTTTSITIQPSLGIATVEFVNNTLQEIRLTFSEEIQRGLVYELSMSNLLDCSGNETLKSDTLIFGIPTLATAREVIISEIMSDPSPTVGLPEIEYVELYNRTDKWIDLSNWRINDATDTTTLQNASLLPHAYKLLISSTAPLAMDTFPNVLRVPNFLSLNNSGEMLQVSNKEGEIIDSVRYASTWYEDVEKKEGGWSLERIDPDNFCVSENDNWKNSLAENGGTPGTVNSVDGSVVDTEGPVLMSTKVQTSNSLLLSFNEKIAFDVSSEFFTLAPAIPIQSSMFTNNDRSQLLLTTSEVFQPSVVYTLTVSQAMDCAGNTFTQQNTFVIAEEAEPKDILITEVMADPSPVVGLPEEEYIELVNSSTKYINLNGWKMKDGLSEATLPTYTVAPGEYVILSANAGAFENHGTSLQLSHFPSLTNSGKSLSVVDASGMTVDSIHYTSAWYKDDNKQNGGWSLEQRELGNRCLESENWMTSLDEKGGTPGRQNSVFTLKADTLGPELVSVTVVNEFELTIRYNEKLSEEELLPTDVMIQPTLSITSVTTNAFDKTITIILSSPLVAGEVYTVATNSVRDCGGNEMESPNTTLTFGIPITAQPHDVIINEIMADPSPTVGLPEEEYVELYNRTNKLINVSGWKFTDKRDTAVFPVLYLLPHEYKTISSAASANQLTMFNSVGLSHFPGMDNSGELLLLINQEGVLIDSVRFTTEWYNNESKKEGGWSIERMDVDNFCLEGKNWRASESPAGGTPGFQNAGFYTQPDSESPQLIITEVRSATEVDLFFDEKLQITTPRTKDFNIEPFVGINEALFSDASLKSVRLVLQSSLEEGVVYNIKVDSIFDCSGNKIDVVGNTGTFGIPIEASAKDVLINEIMADPSPVRSLPEAEYVELYNRTEKFIDLTGWLFTDKRDTALFPSFQLMPYQYVILSNTANSDRLEPYGRTIALANFPALNNEGENLLLLNGQTLIDSVHYSTSWYKNSDKEEGGWSLERKDENQFCLEEENWSAALNELGGTPGQANSNKQTVTDSISPRLQAIEVLTESMLQLSFTETMSAASIITTNFHITPPIPIRAVYFTDNKLTSVHLELAQGIQPGILYLLEVSGVRDCSGNAIEPNEGKTTFGLAAQANYKDVIITEVMADPSPIVHLPEAEYVELYNRSEKLINLGDWKLEDGVGQVALPNTLLLPNEYLIVCSSSVVSSFISFSNVLAVSNFPSLTNNGEAIVIRNDANELIDSVAYTIHWYKDSEKADGGWSLELIDSDNSCGEENNWMASESEQGGTPGQENSVKAVKPDATGPKLLLVVPSSETSLLINFDEKLHKEIFNFSFELSPSIEVDHAIFTNASLKEVTIQLAEKLLPAQLYQLTVTVSDCAGNPIQEEHNKLEFALPQEANEGDIIVNEVLFNPRPFGVDFVELYNASEKFINLKNWSLATSEEDLIVNKERISDSDFLLHPYSFLVLSPDPLIIQTEYPSSSGKAFKQMELPPLNDDEGTVVLIRSDETPLDQLHYSETMHSPLLKEKEGVSLERMTAGGWKSGVAATGFATPGYGNANFLGSLSTDEEVVIEPEIFEPVIGQPNFASIQYAFNRPGLVANAKILDAQGRLVKNLTNNEILGTEGFFTWDGDQEDGTQARIGYYTLWMEVFDTSGFVKTFRKRIVIASRF